MELEKFKLNEGVSNPDTMNGLIEELKAADQKGEKVVFDSMVIILVMLGLYISQLPPKTGT